MSQTKPKKSQDGDVIKEMRRIGVSIESRLTNKFSEMGAGIESRLDKKISQIGREVNQLGVKIERVENKIVLVAENQVGMKEKLDATFEMTGKLVVDLTIVKDNVELIKSSLKKKVDVDEFAALERRTSVLERRH